ncbi:MAG TPA: IclR family transcriptional regulator [Microbacteriaceae bacterium]|nr:IclR family transcriptional regulator [Microbacteriaceae bacterium]
MTVAVGAVRRRHDARSVSARAFALLDAFGADGAVHLTLTELAERAKLPLPTAHRLADECVRWGGLERRRDGSYQLGLKLWKLGLRYPDARELRQVSVPVLQDLYELTHESVQLAVLDGLRAIYLQRIAGRRAVPERTHLGRRVPLHCTGAGLVLLAYGGESLLSEVLAERPERYLPVTMTTLRELRPRLGAIRSAGLAQTRDEYVLGAASTAAPIRDADGDVVAAVSLLAPSGEELDPRYPIAVRLAADTISRGLGWRR